MTTNGEGECHLDRDCRGQPDELDKATDPAVLGPLHPCHEAARQLLRSLVARAEDLQPSEQLGNSVLASRSQSVELPEEMVSSDPSTSRLRHALIFLRPSSVTCTLRSRPDATFADRRPCR